ncbi:MAG: hypothetical protein ACR2O0_07090 [Rhizobiaceae bacterium]
MIRLLTVLIALLFSTLAAFAQENVRVTAELEETEAIVGQPLTLRIKILVPTWMTKGAEFPNLEVPGVMVRLPQRSGGPISETIDGETWSGVSRGYNIFPLEAGTFNIPGQEVTITYADPETSKPVTEKIKFDGVSFKGVLPDAAKQLDPPIIAKGFTLEQKIEGETELNAGDAITRTLTAKINGTTPVLIPALTPSSDEEQVRAYTSEPIVTESENRGDLSGSRVEKTTYVAQKAGPTTIPAVDFSWFNIDTNQIETASVPETKLSVAEGVASSSQELDVAEFAKWLAWFAAVAILAALGYRYLYPPFRNWLEERRRARLASEDYAHKQVLGAIKARDLNAVSNATDKWLAFFPADSLNLHNELESGMAMLGAYEFGTDPQGLASANWSEFRKEYSRLRNQVISDRKKASERYSLPQLNPEWVHKSQPQI